MPYRNSFAFKFFLWWLAAACCCSAVLAAPAPWYHWRSKVDGTRLCLQTSPGSGWERDGGPCDNPRCHQPAPARARAVPAR